VNAPIPFSRCELSRSERVGQVLCNVCLGRQIAFTAAACARARSVFAVCHGSTDVTVFDATLQRLWASISSDDVPGIEGIYSTVSDLPESNSHDTLARDWLAWLCLATFEFPSTLPRTILSAQVLEQSSALLLTICNEIDLRLGWDGAPYGGPLATIEWFTQLRCMELLIADPQNPEIPIEKLLAAGRELGQALAARAVGLAAATGWSVSLDN
jgi:hypothetical protein